MEQHAPAGAGAQVSSGVLAGMENQLRGQLGNGEGSRRALRPLTRQQRFDMEVESFGYPLSWHPLDPFQEVLNGRVTPASDIPRHVGHTITLAGVCLTTKTVKTRPRSSPGSERQPRRSVSGESHGESQGEAMEFLTFEDQTSLFECVLFPTQYRLFSDLVRWEKLFLIRGKVEETWGVYTVTIEKLVSLSRMMEKGSKGKSPLASQNVTACHSERSEESQSH